jgi:MoxR-like ATPase
LAILHSAKAKALSGGRFFVSAQDVRQVATAALRHRIQRNLQAEAEELTPDDILGRIMDEVLVTAERAVAGKEAQA